MGLISCYAVFGRKSKMARTVPVSNAFKGFDKREEALKNPSKGDIMQQSTGSHLVIDCPIHDDASLSDKPILDEGEADAFAQQWDATEIVVDIDRLSSFSVLQHDDPDNHVNELNSSSHISNLTSSCSQETGRGVSLGEGSCSSVLLLSQQDVQGDGISIASDNKQVNRSLHVGDGNSYSDHGDQAKLGQPITRSDDNSGGPDASETSQMDKTDRGEDSGHASDPGYAYVRNLIEESPSPSDSDKELSFVQWPFPSHADEDFSFLPLASLGAAEGVRMDEELGFNMEKSRKVDGPVKGSGSDAMEPSFSRVEEWYNSIHMAQMADDVFSGDEEHTSAGDKGSLTSELTQNEGGDTSGAICQVNNPATTDHTFETVAVQSLHPSSTVAHISGIGLREVPPLGMFSSLRVLNLSANTIVRVPIGCLPCGLQSLDLSRNRIVQIEGFKELNRLRVLNLSHNRIPRIGHGLANCTLIKELDLAGNKIAEVEGLHRLLKLAVLDLSYNKITTSKALSQLAANYGSLLALNLLGNPILTNFSEDQLRKLVTALTPQVTYLNRRPIKTVSVREAALDCVARAALGTPQRSSKSKVVKKLSGAPIGSGQKKPLAHHHIIRQPDKKASSASSSGQQHRHHQRHHHVQTSLKEQGLELVALSKLMEGLQSVALSTHSQGMHRSKSASVLQE